MLTRKMKRTQIWGCAILILGVIGVIVLVSGWKENWAIPAQEPASQGLLLFVSEGQVIGREAFVVERRADSFQLVSQGELSVPGKEFRLMTVLHLSTAFTPQSYSVLQVKEEPPGALQGFVHGQAEFSLEGVEVRVGTLPEALGGVQEEIFPSPRDPWVVLEIDTFSHFVILPRLFQRAGREVLRVAVLHPLILLVGELEVRSLDPIRITVSGQEVTVGRLGIFREGELRQELLLQGEVELIGIVRPDQREPLVFRWDLFPDGFQVVR